MLKGVKRVFSINSEFEAEEYKEELEKTKNTINIQRCKIGSEVLIALNIVLILIDLFIYKKIRHENKAYTYLFYSHIIFTAFMSLWLFTLEILRKNNVTNKNKLMYHVFANLVLYWCVFLSLNSISISGQISPYIIGILALTVSIHLSSKESFVIIYVSQVIFNGGLLLINLNIKVLGSHIINSIIAATCAMVASKFSCYSFTKDFINKKTILKGKAELEATNIKLSEYEKLRSDFFANISHELRTPINVIYSAEQMIDIKINDKEPDISRVNKYLKMIKQNSLRLIKLINNLIDISKIDATIFEVKPTNCDIVRTVENITMSVADYIESRDISLIFDTEIEEKIIACDPEKIERIMLNLLSNAIKFTGKDGEIIVKIYIEDKNVCISVKDTGIGIEKEMKELVFDRFIQVDKSIARNREGSGIGLSLVKSLVELHGGNIKLNSEIGQGSEFIISLPDKLIESKEEENYFNSLQEQRIERIDIEFSDIYK